MLAKIPLRNRNMLSARPTQANTAHLHFAIAVLLTLLLILFYIQPPSRVTAWSVGQQNATAGKHPCDGLPGAEDVFVVLKTGAGEAGMKVPTHLKHTLQCVPRFEIYSDLEETVAGHTIHDALKDLPDSVREKYPEFEAYRALQKYSRGQREEISKALQASRDVKKEDSPGWKLDKWKFLPLLQKAEKHDARWYFFMEADTHIVWSNLLQWLSKLDSSLPWYIGGQAYFEGHVFAHGGAGFILSRKALVAAVEVMDADPHHYHEIIAKDCCGDSIVATLMDDAKVTILKSWPMLQGETPATLDYTERQWCFPVISQHHMGIDAISNMWQLEQDWLASSSANVSRPLKHKDVFQKLVAPVVHDGSGMTMNWDNLSRDEEITEQTSSASEQVAMAYTSSQLCQQLCQEREECVQFSYVQGRCRLGRDIRLGHKVDVDDASQEGIVSGWMQDRVRQFQDSMEPCEPKWILEHSDETG